MAVSDADLKAKSLSVPLTAVCGTDHLMCHLMHGITDLLHKSYNSKSHLITSDIIVSGPLLALQCFGPVAQHSMCIIMSLSKLMVIPDHVHVMLSAGMWTKMAG